MEALKLNVKLLNVYHKQLKKEYLNENNNIIELQDKYDSMLSEIYKNLLQLPDGEKLIKEMINKKTNKRLKKVKNQLIQLTEQEVENFNENIDVEN